MKDYKRENPAVGAYSNTPLNESLLLNTKFSQFYQFLNIIICNNNLEENGKTCCKDGKVKRC